MNGKESTSLLPIPNIGRGPSKFIPQVEAWATAAYTTKEIQMSKQIPRDREIYIAVDILGKYENGAPVAIDKRNHNERLNPKDIDHKIRIYEREVEEWFLNPATDLLEKNEFNNSFVVLMICMAYIEGVEQYKTGVESHRRSEECFKDSIKRLYPNKFQDRDLGAFYKKARCGLFHNGMVKGGVVFSNGFAEPIEFENNGETVRVNPTLLLRDIKDDFRKYINELKGTSNTANQDYLKTIRENFDRMFTVL
jgi:hypothetical protein